MISIRPLLTRLAASRSGVAMTEFALATPLMLVIGLWGAENVNFVLANMKLNQLAVHIADNASRVGETSELAARKVYEGDINDVIVGAQIQAGSAFDLYGKGRVIITSLQGKPDPGGGAPIQYIGWQRCRGAKTVTSSYDTGGTVPADGMGPPTARVAAEADDALIFVEIRYTYQPLISPLIISNREMKAISTFNVRDNRDISQLYQRDPAKPDPVQNCNVYTGAVTLSADGTMI